MRPVKELRANSGHASASRLKRILTDAAGLGATALQVGDAVAGECDVCVALDEAPQLPVAGTSWAPAFDEEGRADLLFLVYMITFHAMDLFSRFSMSVPAALGNPFVVWGAFAASWIPVLGKSPCFRVDSEGEWENEVWTDLRSERNIRLQFQCKGARPCMLGRRNGLARGIYSRLHEDGRFVGRAILHEDGR